MNMQNRIDRCIVRMTFKAPCYAALAMSLEPCESAACPTMATDGVSLFYNAEGIEQANWTDEHVMAVICHEVEHCARLHMCRRGDRDMQTWNMATDYVINESVADSGFMLPQGCLREPQYAALAEEQVYELLAEQEQEQERGPGECQGGGDDGSGEPSAEPPCGSASPCLSLPPLPEPLCGSSSCC